MQEQLKLLEAKVIQLSKQLEELIQNGKDQEGRLAKIETDSDDFNEGISTLFDWVSQAQRELDVELLEPGTYFGTRFYQSN